VAIGKALGKVAEGRNPKVEGRKKSEGRRQKKGLGGAGKTGMTMPARAALWLVLVVALDIVGPKAIEGV
jgi:hypothetical protein